MCKASVLGKFVSKTYSQVATLLQVASTSWETCRPDLSNTYPKWIKMVDVECLNQMSSQVEQIFTGAGAAWPVFAS